MVFLVITTIMLSNSLLVAAQVSSGLSWATPNNNSSENWNYSSQNQINASNIGKLSIKWFFPVSSNQFKGKGGEGVTAPILAVNGVVYLITNFHELIAIDGQSGQFIWQKYLPASVINDTLGNQYLSMLYTRNVTGHPLLWVGPDSYHVVAFDALTGDVRLSFKTLDSDNQISGNFGTYSNTPSHFVIDEKSGILIAGGGGRQETSDGRAYLRAFNVSSGTPQLLWTSYLMPPQDGSDQNWSLSSVLNMSSAFVFNGSLPINLKSLPLAQLQSMLFGDWGKVGYDGNRSYAGLGFSGGSNWAIDSADDMVYVGTSAPGPSFNATSRPGLNLWSDSILALNESSGRIVWAFQTRPHDLSGYGCAWNVALATININGKSMKAVIKSCGDGETFALNAVTGDLIWSYRPASMSELSCTNGSQSITLDPTNKQEMSSASPCSSSSGAVTQDPPTLGGTSNDVTFDPSSNLIFTAALSEQQKYQINDVTPNSGSTWTETQGRSVLSVTNSTSVDSSVYALNASTGTLVWKSVINKTILASGITASSGLVYLSLLNGTLLALNAITGSVVSHMDLGSTFSVHPTLGADVPGKEILLLISSSTLPDVVPQFDGDVLALELPPAASGGTQSSTLFTIGSTNTSALSITSSGSGGNPFAIPTYVAIVVIVIAIIALLLLMRRRK
jgi:alcohol dehydrogenase (cytochrome c)